MFQIYLQKMIGNEILRLSAHSITVTGIRSARKSVNVAIDNFPKCRNRVVLLEKIGNKYLIHILQLEPPNIWDNVVNLPFRCWNYV